MDAKVEELSYHDHVRKKGAGTRAGPAYYVERIVDYGDNECLEQLY